MKKEFFVWTAFLICFIYTTDAFACRGSGCTPCESGYSFTEKCCKNSDQHDCLILGKELEDCGQGEWESYPHSLPVISSTCCTDSSENYCFATPSADYCGTGKFAKFPYSPVKKCCKDSDGQECVTILAKRRCGKYQLEDYPRSEGDCCRPDSSECTGSYQLCPRGGCHGHRPHRRRGTSSSSAQTAPAETE